MNLISSINSDTLREKPTSFFVKKEDKNNFIIVMLSETYKRISAKAVIWFWIAILLMD